jgi:GT2 family glycosyltransferase
MSDAPAVSIVVLVHDRPEYTHATLDAATRLSRPTPHELIVVDNGSGRETRALLHAWEKSRRVTKVVRLPANRGTAGGYNAGFAAADPRSRFLTKLDNDVRVETFDWIGRILEVFRDVEDAGVVATDIQNHHALPGLEVFERAGHRVKSWVGWIAGGGGMTFRRETYERLGGFREDFGRPDLLLQPDDFEFYCRVQRLGLAGYYACAARSHHQEHLDGKFAAYEAWKAKQYDVLNEEIFPTIVGDGNETEGE